MHSGDRISSRTTPQRPVSRYGRQPGIRAALAFLLVCLLLVSPRAALYGQAKVSDTNGPANGTGVMVAGELWDSFMLFNNMTQGPWYGEGDADVIRQIRVGNFDRAWSTPTHMWPGGWNFGAFWNKAMEISVWDPDATFNPQAIGGTTNPSHFSGAGPNYAFAAFGNTKRGRTLPGTDDLTRNYSIETKWVDPTKRHHAVYEASSPTTVGVDVKMKIHQYTLNWNNFNDFIIVELTLTNTGVVDMNADGIAEKTGHVVEGICSNMHAECFLSANARITILDVSGQIVDQFRFESADGANGSMFWNLLSRNGIEVASGLYIYLVEYDGGRHVGYFSVLF